MSATREVWGAEVSLLTLAAALRARGVDVAVVALPGELAEQAHLAGHEVHVADPGSETRRVLVAGVLWREYVRHVEPGDRLVLFSYILTAWAPLYRRRLSARGVRVSLDLHDQLESRKAFWSVRVASEAVDTVIACSAFTAAQMGAREGVFALHRPVTTDAVVSSQTAGPADSVGSDHSLRTVAAPVDGALGSRSHVLSTRMPSSQVPSSPMPLTDAGTSQTEGPAVASERASLRATRAGVADAPAVRHLDHGAGRIHRGGGRGGESGVVRRPASRGLMGGTATEPAPGFGQGRPFRIGVVGRISCEKRHELVVAAMSLVDRDVQLVVRGSAFGEAEEYAAEIDEIGTRLLGPRYVNEGRVPAAEALSGLDAVVVGNPAEPMGRTVLEAQLRGVVAVVPDTGGSCELVENEVTGLVYKAGDADDLARVLRRIVDEPELASHIAECAVDSVPRPAEYAAAYLSRLG